MVSPFLLLAPDEAVPNPTRNLSYRFSIPLPTQPAPSKRRSMRVTNMIGAVCVRKAMTIGILGATAAHAAGPAAVDLGSAATLVILAKAGISDSSGSSITGDIGISPGSSSFIIGFNLLMDPSDVFATSPQVAGRVFAANYAVPTPSNLATAVGDMQSAYIDASTRTPADFTGLYGGDLSGRTLAPGLYKWNSSVLLSGGVTLAGGPNDVWIFQVAQDLTVAPQGFVSLSGAPKSSNIFWQVAGTTTLGMKSRIEGIVLCATQIVMDSESSLLGRALTQSYVALASSTLLAGASDTMFIDGFE